MSESTFHVNRREKEQTLAAVVKARLSLSWSAARKLIERRQVRINGQTCIDDVRRLKTGDEIRIELEHLSGAAKPKPVPSRPKPARELPKPRREKPSLTLVHLDEHIVVVEKPPGVTTMRHADEAREFGARAQKYLPTTLADLLPEAIGDSVPVRPVHRLDRDTSGLVVFARTAKAESELGKQFRAHSVARRYLAIVRGRPAAQRIESWLVADRGDGRRGSSSTPGEGQRAITHVRVVEELGRYTLVECRLETGRTHQVRIHLGEQGTPLCGERVYDRPRHGAPIPDESGAKRIALHAAFLGLHHPVTDAWLEWESPLPGDMMELLETLRAKAQSAHPKQQ